MNLNEVQKSSDPDVVRNSNECWKTSTADTVKQSVYLIAQRSGRAQLIQYFPLSPHGTGAKFVFPRKVNGEGIASPRDKMLRSAFYCPVINYRVLLEFKPAKMVYEGQLSY